MQVFPTVFKYLKLFVQPHIIILTKIMERVNEDAGEVQPFVADTKRCREANR